MSDSRRARTLRRLTGGVCWHSLLGLAIERAGAQQQGSVGANVNVISGTGADGDWTLQRQNEPTIACSSRNPQNCLAGANDYRTVDIPFPRQRREDHRRRLARLVHDARTAASPGARGCFLAIRRIGLRPASRRR